MPDFLEAILQSRAAKICVIAAPGSGKTKRILLPKAQQILSDRSLDPGKVLLLTFSRLSALDLKARAKTLERVPRASTVHSYCLSFLLAEDDHEIRRRVESILLDFEKEILLCDLKLVFPRNHKTQLKKWLSEFAAGWATTPHEEVFEEDDGRRAFKAAVVNWLSEHNAAMMEEIVYHAVRLARTLPDARLIDEPQYILVDEYQDLNRLEQEFIDALARRSELLLVVGDPDQSIYSFKYAHPNGIREFAARDGVEAHGHRATGRCAVKIVDLAKQLLRQAAPGRDDLLSHIPGAPEGEVHLIRKEFQDAEFTHVLEAIARRLADGVSPKEIIILAPRRKLGSEFARFCTAQKERVGIEANVQFQFVLKPEFTEKEQERILLIGLLVQGDSLLRIRSYLGLSDEHGYSKEVVVVKEKYGGLREALQRANPNDFPLRNTRVRGVCERLVRLRATLAENWHEKPVREVLDHLFPADDAEVVGVRSILDGLLEDEDNLASLLGKFIDYMRTMPATDNTVRVMTLMASKGLDADHVYIIGCNSGNLPGKNRSSNMSDDEHRQEQRRLLYVGVTRARKSVSISWSRLIPFEQALGHYTKVLRIVTRGGRRYSEVGVCEFLQDLPGVVWE